MFGLLVLLNKIHPLLKENENVHFNAQDLKISNLFSICGAQAISNTLLQERNIKYQVKEYGKGLLKVKNEREIEKGKKERVGQENILHFMNDEAIYQLTRDVTLKL